MAYIIQRLSYYKNSLLCNSISHVAQRATLCYCAVLLMNAMLRGQTVSVL